MLNLTYLKYLLAVQKYGSITKASKNLFVTQPNISKAIKYLEEDLNIQLLSRSRSGSCFTPEGLNFLEEIKPIVESLEIIYHRYQNAEVEQKIPMLYFLPSSLIENIIVDSLAEKNFELHFYQCPLFELISRIETDDNTYAFIYYPISSDTMIKTLLDKHNIKSHLIAKDKMYLLTSMQNSILDDDFSHMTYVFYENLIEDSKVYLEMPLIQRFLQQSNVIQVSNRMSEYKLLNKVSNTISLSIRQPKETLLMYKLKLVPLQNEEVCFLMLHKNEKKIEFPKEIVYIAEKLRDVLKQEIN